jgi:hypothetical protein
MNKYTMYFFTRCTDPEREEEYNSWYSHVHVPELQKARGLTSAKRYASTDPNCRAKYLAVYEFETRDIHDALRSFFQLVRKSFQEGKHIDCIESVTNINAPYISCYQEVNQDQIAKQPCRKYPSRVPEALDRIEELIGSNASRR